MSRLPERARDAVFGKAANVLKLETEELTARWCAIFQRRLANRGEPGPPEQLDEDVASVVRGVAAVLLDPWTYRRFIGTTENHDIGHQVAEKHVISGGSLTTALEGYMRLRRELIVASRDVFRRGDHPFFDLMTRVDRCIDRVLFSIAEEYSSAFKEETERLAAVNGQRGQAENALYPEYLEDALAAIDALGPGPEEAAAGVAGEGEEGAPPGAVAGAPTTPEGLPARRHVYRGFETERLTPHRLACRVRIARNDTEFVGEADGPDVPLMRAEIAARAALDAIRKAEGSSVQLALQGAKVLRAFDRRLVVAGVYGFRGRREVISLIGACPVNDSVENAATLAVLQATNRWIPLMASQKEGQ